MGASGVVGFCSVGFGWVGAGFGCVVAGSVASGVVVAGSVGTVLAGSVCTVLGSSGAVVAGWVGCEEGNVGSVDSGGWVVCISPLPVVGSVGCAWFLHPGSRFSMSAAISVAMIHRFIASFLPWGCISSSL